ncbi:bumetanide-sensitive sodium-(potassium)-chloride cotransporter-like isoform X2 [Daktulosphaira vitifoliae]|uniref:bumetanide-sensitive sodium-(potassium)-chloride cotransporter-like isoform X2 n=1 Tax=Daktulosphaira vitifoliae TaxID=58002 RepID=UPI0021AA18C9|nr:bumetanide-sensitive sodium-(potassium)-chloride cotransporter-like isoform X2 [Daktulosphaira vitifoliae]
MKSVKKKNILNYRLMKIGRLHLIFNSLNLHIFTKWSHVVILFILLIPLVFEFITAFCCILGYYYLSNDLNACVQMILIILAICTSTIKVIRFIKKPNEFWELFNVMRDDFLSFDDYNNDIIFKFKKKCTKLSNAYSLVWFISWMIWIFIPIFIKEYSVKIKSGNRVIYRYNILNAFIGIVPIENYENLYLVIYVIEAVNVTHAMLIVVVYDVFTMSLCWILSAQLKTIASRYETFGRETLTNELKNSVISTDILKLLIKDHIKVNNMIKKFNQFTKPQTIIQLAINSNIFIITTFVFISNIFSTNKTSFNTLNLLSTAFAILLNLYISCYFFGQLEYQESSMNFAMYSCNWTNKDINFKKSLLLAMNMNNAHNIAIKVTPTKYVNLELFSRIQSYEKLVDDEEKKIDVGKGVKLGWIKGVLIPCLLSIWGVMLFLRLPWIVGQAGIRDSIIIILISLTIILITTFSLSAISTNGRIRGGGLYFIISRSIGPEFGSSIGILLALANIISSAINTIGFCLSLNLLLKSYDIYIMDNEFGFKAVGISLIILMGITCAIGMDREAIVQDILLFAIIIGIFNVYIGSIRGPTNITAKASGFTGYNMETFMKNWYPDYRMENHIKLSFFAVFSIFFPSVTGIQAGANISGDLKDPSASIPKGTLLSIFITIMSYIMLVLVIGSVHLREASGIPEELFNGTYLNCSTSLVPACKEGLYSNVKLMQTISYWPVLIYLGTFGATISTALTALISVPKILQRMGQDQVYPLLKYLAKGYGITNEPYHAHIFAVLVTSTFFMISELNKAASFMSTIYLCAYALLNLSTFHVAHFNHVGWRPTYKFYNKWLSLAGSIICLSVMISIDPSMSMFVFVGIWILYKIASRKKEEVNWGSSMKIQRYKSILKNLRNVYIIKYHAKNYLTNITVLSGEPNLRKGLISLGHLIANKNGLLVCINVEKEKLSHKERQVILDKGIEWLKSCKLNCLYNVLDSVKLDEAVRMTYMCGHGQLRPNIVLVGYKTDWLDSSDNELHSYLNVFNEASLNEISTLMVRYPSIVRNNSMPKKNCPRQISPIENRIEHFDYP